MVQQAYWDLPQRCSVSNNFGDKHLFYLRGQIFKKIYYVLYLLRFSILILRTLLYRDNYWRIQTFRWGQVGGGGVT